MSEAFLKIVNMSISASWLVLVVLALRFLLKKAPKWVNVLLWGFVAIRLICPFSIESAMSLIPSAEVFSPTVLIETPEINTGIPVINNAVNPIIQDAVITLAPEKNINAMKFLIQLFSQIWTVGVVLFLVYSAVSFWRLRRRMRTAVILRDNIFLSEFADSPFVLGIVRPRIYLPYGMDERDIVHVIAHEQAHIRRKDHWWKPLGFLLLTVHWFNPLMWVAYILLCRDIELACDEKVIKDLGSEQRGDYSQALVACSVNRRMIAACPLAFGEVGVKERVRSVMNYKKPAFWIVILAVIACVSVAVCFLTDPRQDRFVLRIVIPAGSTEEIVYQEDFFYSDEEISPKGNTITISSGEGLGDTEVVLKPIEAKEENAYEPTYLTPGMPVEMDVEKGAWFKVGVNIQNPTDEDIDVYVAVENVEVRISDEAEPDGMAFQAEVLDIHDGYFLVEPVEGSPELRSADRIEVPMKNMHPSPEIEVGDVIEIVYSGELMETYPARIGEVSSIRVVMDASRQPAYEPKGVSGGNVKELNRLPDDVQWQSGIGFSDLAPGEEILSDQEIVIEEDGASMLLTISWTRASLYLEYGIRRDDGTEYFQEKRGGYSHLEIEDIPAGSYRLFVKNSDAYAGIPAYENPAAFEDVSFNAVGAMNYALGENGHIPRGIDY